MSISVHLAPVAVPARPFGAARRPRHRLSRNGRVVSGLTVFIFFVLVALAAPLIAPYDPLKLMPAHSLEGPSAAYWLGTDDLGRDTLSRLVYGSRISLGVALSSIAAAGVAGVLLGLLAGYYGGLVDAVIMRAMDVVLAFPPILLAVAMVAFLGASIPNLIWTIALLYVPRFARVVYAATQTIKQNAYVEASRAVGASDGYLLRRVLLPNIMAPILVQSSLALGYAILLESGLSFMGLGTQPPTPSWGQMIASGRGLMEQMPFLVLWPSLVIAATIVAFNVLGDGLRDTLDPRLRGR